MFLQRIRQSGRFIRFIFRSGNRYNIHSPFLYDLVQEVIRKRKKIPCSKAIESLRNECLNSNEMIIKTDFGKTAQVKGLSTYPVSLRSLARSSVTSPRHARRLYRLAEKIRAERILEIGTSLGFTTAYLSCARPDAQIVTLEGCHEISRIAGEHFRTLGIKNIDLITGRFEDTLEPALKKLNRADLVYIDGNHRRAAVLEYFDKCLAFAGNETVFVFDDIHSSDEMEQAWELIRKRDEVRISLDFFFNGWIFLRKESSRQHFSLRYI
jgi:predicted O-methyltransferase YrrM